MRSELNYGIQICTQKRAVFYMKVKNQIASTESEFQRIDILDTEEFGKVLVVLDGELMITQKR